jgi:hypothetical protein
MRAHNVLCNSYNSRDKPLQLSSCMFLTCDMYKSSLRHIHDPVLSSLKMKGIRLLLLLRSAHIGYDYRHTTFFHVKYQTFMSNFNDTWILSTGFQKNIFILNVMKVRPVGAKLFNADRQTDMTKLMVAFLNFANVPRKWLNYMLY